MTVSIKMAQNAIKKPNKSIPKPKDRKALMQSIAFLVSKKCMATQTK